MSENDSDGRASMSAVTVTLYTAWAIGLGAGLLRIRIEYGLGELFTLLGLFVCLTLVCTLIWFKVFEPWDEYAIQTEGGNA